MFCLSGKKENLVKQIGKLIFSIVIILFIGTAKVFGEGSTIDLDSLETSPLFLANSMLVLEDQKSNLDFDTIQSPEFASKFIKVPSSPEAFNFSYSKSTYWLRVQLRNTNPISKDLVIVVAYPRLKTMDLYLQNANGIIKINSGYSVPHNFRPYKSRFLVFPIFFPGNSNATIYLKVNSPNAINLPIALWNKVAYDRHEIDDHVVQALYFGIVLAMAIFNLFVFFIRFISSFYRFDNRFA